MRWLDVRRLGVRCWTRSAVALGAVLTLVVAGACGSEEAEPPPSAEDLPIVAVAVDDDQRGVRQPQPVTEYDIRIPTSATVNSPIGVRVSIRDRGTIIARDQAPELVWPVSVIFVHEDDEVPSEQSRLEPSQDPFGWSTRVRLPMAGRWRSIIQLLGITQPGPTVEVTEPTNILSPPTATLANETTVYQAPGYELGARSTLMAGQEVVVRARVVDGEGRTWFKVAYGDLGYVEEDALSDFVASVRVVRVPFEQDAPHALVLSEQVVFRYHPETEPRGESPAAPRDTLLTLGGRSPDGRWLTVQAGAGFGFWIANDPEQFAFDVDPATLPIAAFDGTWLVDLLHEAPEPIRFVTRHLGPAAWLAPGTLLPCREGQESVVTLEYSDEAWLYADTCDVRAGPASPAVFARAWTVARGDADPEMPWIRDGMAQLVDEAGRVLAEVELRGWWLTHQQDPIGQVLSWSPDGQALLIHEVHNSEERTEDGRAPLKILQANRESVDVGLTWQAQWTPLGTVIYRLPEGWNEINADGTPANNYILEGHQPFSFSPRGDVVARAHVGAWIFSDLSGQEVGRLEQQLEETYGPLHWSPDGRFASTPRVSAVAVVLDLDTGAITTLPNFRVLAWSPDGRLLAAERATRDGRVREFVVITREGELVSEPIEAFGLSEVHWSPDSQAVTFQTVRGGA